MTTSPARPLPAVQLRVPTDEDARAWQRVFDDAEVMEFLGGPAELSLYEELTARQRLHDARLGFCLWTLLDAQGAVIGFTGAQPWPETKPWGPVGEIEIGWRLGRGAWGQGYAYAAALATLERVRAAGVPHVVAMINDGNARSIAVAERLGMTLAERFLLPNGVSHGRRYTLDLGPAAEPAA
ncbi:GNAT family N-acetyltransferase [Streptomyces subrutilus]|uniref:N-acetyltransferase n=1 Tax=Streptomyces subrutilus TaxID=36818 RepID=A0A5P2UJD1_9ACTN|nr:GNAT family N-acetyltransferase [Streptomyces subrutilus]QEU79373.1 N-acetyltransferase [Streptomyces subrutilus]WSJ31430.1 GNAT family N-acetyltransferase [Streptomyces subrutilus]GGZ54097.1 N-acetyltransferase [Streptomyces subrutilus]